MRMIGAEDIRRAVPMREAIAIVAEAMKTVSAGGADQPNRWIMPLEPGKGMAIMPGALKWPAVHGIKLLSIYPGNPARGLSSHQGVMVIFDTESGTPLAALEASTLTALRTAAASAVATDALARRDASVLALVGAGEQAEWHLETLPLIRDLREIRIHSRTPEKAERLAAHHRGGERVVRVVTEAEAAVDGADIVVTTTSSKEPVLRGEWLAPGQHVTLVGASMADAREIDEEGVARARYFVDSRQSASAQAGELIAAIRAGRVGDDHIVAEIGEVLGKTRPGRRSAEEITVYKSHGIAAQDLAVGHEIYRRLSA